MNKLFPIVLALMFFGFAEEEELSNNRLESESEFIVNTSLGLFSSYSCSYISVVLGMENGENEFFLSAGGTNFSYSCAGGVKRYHFKKRRISNFSSIRVEHMVVPILSIFTLLDADIDPSFNMVNIAHGIDLKIIEGFSLEIGVFLGVLSIDDSKDNFGGPFLNFKSSY